MKILLIHCHYRLPGGEDAVFAAERALLEQHGHTVVVYERSNEEAAHGAAKALLPFRAVWNRRAARDVRNIIEQQHIDAVHIHNTLLLLSPAVVRAAKKCGVPVVLTLHNFRLFCPNGILLRDGRVCEDCPHHGLHTAAPLLPRQPGADARRRGRLLAASGAGHMARHRHHHPHRV